VFSARRGAGAGPDGTATGRRRAPTATVPFSALPFHPLESKLHPPQSRLDLVRREGLLATLRGSHAALVLVSAAAGTGKTTLLSQWATSVPRPAAWLQLDRTDDDSVVLTTYLALALSRVAPVDPALFGLLCLPMPPLEERILPMLALCLSEAPPFVLVIDDTHHLTDERSWRLLSALLHSLPPGAQVGLGSRSDPPLPLARMVASGSLLEVRGPDLAFDHDEAAKLFAFYTPEPDCTIVHALLEASQGWATALYLASLAGRGRPFDEWPTLVHGDRREIAAFLTSEVLDRQAPEIQEFLLRTAILDRVVPAACRALTGRDDAGELLRRLARDNLFVSPVSGRADAFRYHPLFAELLQLQLERRAPAAVVGLHRRAAEWSVAQGDVDAAIRHRLAAGDVDEAADLVCSAWRGMWEQGRAETVRRWLASFNDEQIMARAGLTLTAGWVYSAFSDVRRGELWANRACSAVADDSPSCDGAASLRSSQAMLRAALARDGVTPMRDEAELAARLERTTASGWYAEARWTLGFSRWLSGSTRQALHPLQIAAREGRSFNFSAELAALGLLALMAIDEGDWQEAEEYVERAEERLSELAFGSNRRVLPMLLARARILARVGDPEVHLVEERVADVLERMVPHPPMSLLAAIVLGEVALERRDLAAAERWSGRAREILRRYPDAGVLRGKAERLGKASDEAQEREPLTPSERRVLELLPTHLTENEIAERLFVSKNTVKTHLRGLYRKLEAGSRSAAVDKARELGLLKGE
jgi:LuxR family maltose regulon positive regulatory protein